MNVVCKKQKQHIIHLSRKRENTHTHTQIVVQQFSIRFFFHITVLIINITVPNTHSKNKHIFEICANGENLFFLFGRWIEIIIKVGNKLNTDRKAICSNTLFSKTKQKQKQKFQFRLKREKYIPLYKHSIEHTYFKIEFRTETNWK